VNEGVNVKKLESEQEESMKGERVRENKLSKKMKYKI